MKRILLRSYVVILLLTTGALALHLLYREHQRRAATRAAIGQMREWHTRMASEMADGGVAWSRLANLEPVLLLRGCCLEHPAPENPTP